MAITIVPYSSSHKEQLIELIVTIQQQEFGVPITREEQPDLQDIPNIYQQRNGNFWVALAGDVVVGTIALLDIGNHQGALRKMFVAAAYRGKAYGVGQALLNTLLDWAVAKSYTDIYLGTTALFHAAHRFYEKNGFKEILPAALPASFLRVNVDTKFYHYTITN